MNTLSKLGLLGCVVLGGGALSPLQQAFAESATGSASVEIRQPLVVSQTTPMNFGSVSAESADILTLTPAGAISSQNGARVGAGSIVPGQFLAVGSNNSAVTISFTNATLAGAGAPMTMNNLTHDAGSTPSFSADGKLAFAVGADLIINDAQAPGVYSGTYEVSVNYQ